MDVNRQLALHLLSVPRAWTDRRRLDAAATVLLICTGNLDEILAAEKGIEQKRYRLDSKLIADLYASGSKPLKLALASTSAFFRLEPSTFKRLFRDAYALEPMAQEQRQGLVSALVGFLVRHPEEANSCADIILDLLRSRRWSLCLPALEMAGLLDDIEERDLELMRRRMLQRVELRMNALNGFCRLVKRHKEISPKVLSFCTSPEMKRLARRIHRTDPDKDVRTCAYYLLKAFKEL